MNTLSDKELDEIMKNINIDENKKPINNKNKKINLDNIDMDDYDTQTKKAIKELSILPDYYKILGVNINDTIENIKINGQKKISKFHPDKVKSSLQKITNLDEREKEKKSIEMQYKLVTEAYNVLKDPNRRKQYDLEKKTIDGKDFISQKKAFKDFIELNNSEIVSEDKKKLNYLLASQEFDKKNNFKKDKLTVKPLTKEECAQKFTDLQMQRDMEFNEIIPKNKFMGKTFNLVDFNENWERQNKKHLKKSKNNDSSLILLDGISAANDVGLTGGSNFISIDANYDDLFTEKNSDLFTSVLLSDDEDNNSNSNNDDNIISYENEFDDPRKYVTGHNENRDPDELTKKMLDFSKSRDNDLFIQQDKTTTDSYWNDVLDNPLNISSQMGSVIGNIKQGGISNKTKYLQMDKIDAYKKLVMENT
jgi:curved DNA-binding protein CbpA